jgi:hypothetical protein
VGTLLVRYELALGQSLLRSRDIDPYQHPTP